MTELLTHSQLVDIAERWLWGRNCGIVLRELTSLGTAEIPDAIGWRSDTSILIECKVSRADFLADRSKPFRAEPNVGVGRWRFYLTSPGLVTVDELPTSWGLLETRGKVVRVVHGGPAGNYWAGGPLAANERAEQGMLYSALRRLVIRGHLPEIYEPLGNVEARP